MIRYLLLLPFNLLMTFINYTCAPVIALFCRSDWTLPGWLAWFSTTDSLMNGDGGDYDFYHDHIGQNRWWVCMLWLWRNPINGFDEGPCGARYSGKWDYSGDLEMEQPMRENRLLWRVKHYGVGSLLFKPFELYVKFRWCSTRYFRLRLGWKLTGMNPAQYVFVPSPFKPVH